MENHTIYSRIVGICIASLLWLAMGVGYACASDSEEKAETVVIPLDQIWALDMPGTKDVRKLEAKVFFRREFPVMSVEEALQLQADSLILQIRLALQEKHGRGIGNMQRCGFVVKGERIEALRAIHSVIVKKEAPNTAFRSGSKLSLCFYSLQAGAYVQLTSVLKQGNRIELHYHFQSHFTADMSDHFALVPLVYSDIGEKTVAIIQDPNLWEQPVEWKLGDIKILTTNEEWGANLICRPFSFQIN